MKTSFPIILLIAGIFLFSCQSPPRLEEFDPSSWRHDQLGCTGERKGLEEILWDQRGKLLDLDESQVIDLLGKPNQIELYVRNQKFFVYYISASAACDQGSTTPRRLIIRFDALNYSNEISIKN